MSEQQKSQQDAEERVEDLEVDPKDAEDVKGGLTTRKAGGKQEDYLQYKLENVQITSYS